ncbi:MAG: carbamoyltransferase HypF [Chitinophagaceae bacterium]
MQTWHIHISGLVQGVGFRPHVFRLAHLLHINGTVNNTSNGVHIYVTAEESLLKQFYKSLVEQPPANAIITHHDASIVPLQTFQDFSIIESEDHQQPELLITPDFGICDHCKQDLFNKHNRRYHYPFVTCTECGPRYSIINALPYDRPNTTMSEYEQCWQCKKEYHNPSHRRYYSQTNSCDTCGIPMHLYNSDGEHICSDVECILIMIKDALLNGHIIAVKGIGGYLIMCDATNYFAIKTLRERKQRPSKPLAVLYPSIYTIERDVMLHPKEKEALQSIVAPIVLCQLKPKPSTGICTELIAPELNKIGIMLPYAPLLALIADTIHKPLVATSGNISGAPIIYKDEEALESLGEIADFVVTYDREITLPQDDSVMQFSNTEQQQIILRRSRGLAPNYLPFPFAGTSQMLAMGADMKGSFAILQQKQCYISQYLGDQGSYDAQQAYKHTLHHLTHLLQTDPELCIADKHPGYFSTELAKNYAAEQAIPFAEVQHHKAHFAAVLAENQLLTTNEPVLGVVWDGTGYGDDGQIWGGEFFIFDQQEIQHHTQLNYFPVLMGDKMAKEPRLSALSLCSANENVHSLLSHKFSSTEYSHYNNLLKQKQSVLTSSMGRLLDGIASILGVCDVMTHEAEAAMQLEALALRSDLTSPKSYTLPVMNHKVDWMPMLEEMMTDLNQSVPKEKIAFNLHYSLVKLIERVAAGANMQQIAFSGGVFQNSLLVDLLIQELKPKYTLFFHQQLSPNDECISFGQLAYMQLQMDKQANNHKFKKVLIS